MPKVRHERLTADRTGPVRRAGRGVFLVLYERPLYPGYVGLALGTFSTLGKARAHIAQAKKKPGFVDDPARFSVEFWELDSVSWKSGFTPNDTMHGPDVPHWARRRLPMRGESGRTYATRVCDERFGPGVYRRGPGSEYDELKKRVLSNRTAAVESNAALRRGPAVGGPTSRRVWELSHEHERCDEKQHCSDHVKNLGFFSSRESARCAKASLVSKPGFRETAKGFYIGRCSVDTPMWEEGFTVYTYGAEDGASGVIPAWFQPPA
jgi:hypothetical protein